MEKNILSYLEENYSISEALLKERGLLELLISTPYEQEILYDLERKTKEKNSFSSVDHKRNYGLKYISYLKYIKNYELEGFETFGKELLLFLKKEYNVSKFSLSCYNPNRFIYIHKKKFCNNVLKRLEDLSKDRVFTGENHKRKFAIRILDSVIKEYTEISVQDSTIKLLLEYKLYLTDLCEKSNYEDNIERIDKIESIENSIKWLKSVNLI